MEHNNNNKFDEEDTGIFMKQESIYDPTPMTPTQPRSSFLSTTSPETLKANNKTQIKKIASYGNMGNQTEARVLVLYTGGTIGMLRNDKNGK